MAPIPTFHTDRLILRPFSLNDAPKVKELAGEWEIAERTATLPHPYEEGMAEAWIGSHQETFDKGDGITFAVERKAEEQLVGAIALTINQAHHYGEIGYWIGKPFWSQGYATEAARELLRYAFDELGLNRVQARHMTKNPASGRVMQKIGMQYEGVLRQSVYRWEKFEDVAMYSILRDEYQP